MTNNNDFFGLKISPVDLLTTVLNEALAGQASPAKGRQAPEFDVKSHFDNLAAKGQGFFESFNVPNFFDEKADTVANTPAVDILVSENDVTYLVGAPGVTQEYVSVELEDTKLTISIHAPENLISSGEPTRNWNGGEWSRNFVIPTGDGDSTKKIDEGKISATVENGLVYVLVPFKAPKVTKIKISNS